MLCFRAREEKVICFKAARLMHLGHKYLDGYATALVLGIETPAPEPDNAEGKIIHALSS